MIEELLEKNSTETIKQLMKEAPEFFRKEINTYNQNHSENNQTFEYRMIQKEVKENLLSDLYRIAARDKYQEETARYFNLDPFWIREEHILNLYSFFVSSLEKGGRFKHSWKEEYPVFFRAIEIKNPTLFEV